MYTDFFEENDKIGENDIQFLYQTHPYLIDPRFSRENIQYQYPLPSGFADIVAFLETTIIVVELKINKIIPQDILQLNGYMEDLQKKFPKKEISGMIIGKKPTRSKEFLVNSLNFHVDFKILGVDIPIKIKICKNCRKANHNKNVKCVFCSTSDWLED
ncbi:MAG: endonuclease NucS domain-containing protein [Candidatus Helarchaeota archaeon]